MKKDVFLEELDSMFNGKTAEQIHLIAKAAYEEIEMRKKEFYKYLYYLEWRKTFKKIKQFKSFTFEQYIFEQFGMSIQNYRKIINAYFKFPEESENLGIGTVVKIMNKVEPVKVETVLHEAEKLINNPQKIEELVEKNKKKVKVHSLKEIKIQLEAEKNRNIQFSREKKEDVKQIEKLKVAFNKRVAEIEDLKAENKALKSENKAVKSENAVLKDQYKALEAEAYGLKLTVDSIKYAFVYPQPETDSSEKPKFLGY